MARDCVRPPRYIPTPKLIAKTWGRQLLAYHLADHFADMEDGQ